jgi:hypothetical protein
MTDAKHKGLYAALAAAQAEMGPALKDSTNPAFKSKYADLASVMAACMPALSKHGIAVLQPAFDDDGGRYVKTIFVHGDSGESTECRVPLIVAKNDMQGYGSAVTYARRYGLMGMAGIAPEDDDGAAAAKAPPKDEPRNDAPKVTTQSVISAVDYLNEADALPDLQLRWNNLPKLIQAVPDVIAAKDAAKVRLTKPNADLDGDDIPENLK